MRKRSIATLLLGIMLLPGRAAAQESDIYPKSENYEWPAEEKVRQNLKQWQDLKFGVIFHWGIYAVPGIVESWSICDEDWIRRDTTRTYQQYVDWYFGLADAFRPYSFDPHQWARVCRQAGMKYMIFTTKHHDGFCMFDSKETDYTIARHAFRDDPRRDVLRHVLDAFREEQFTVGTYFSKPDWHSQDYWWDVYAKKGRNVNYDVRKYPQRWEHFKQFVHNQIRELMTNYGRVDILWLDGGWVRKENLGQDIDMPQMARIARQTQPGLIIVDRTVRGPYENYQTPEQSIPKEQLPYPWESCITLTTSWGWNPMTEYKSPQKVIATLIEIVAKGGNLLLGIGPTPDGLIDPESEKRLQAIGQWLQANGKAIYNTVITPHYNEGNLWFTRSKDGSLHYAIYRLPEGETLPTTLSWTDNLPRKAVRLLSNGKSLKYRVEGNRVSVTLPAKMPQESFAMEVE